MDSIGSVGIIIILLNLLFSYKGFKDAVFFDQYLFRVEDILLKKDYKRMISSGFLHGGWLHLSVNMISFSAFCGLVENTLGVPIFILIYLISLVGGNLFALFIHRNHEDYSAIGASGAVCGVIFAAIAINPSMEIGFFGLDLAISNWLYGLIFVLFTIFGIRTKRDNIGHEAHLGGALLGMITAIAVMPSVLFYNGLAIASVIVPSVAFLFLLYLRPHTLLLTTEIIDKDKFDNIDHKYNAAKRAEQLTVDQILEKIRLKGVASLSEEEKKTLEDFSKS
jgi:membrane associated rhomboid family serine protease